MEYEDGILSSSHTKYSIGVHQPESYSSARMDNQASNSPDSVSENIHFQHSGCCLERDMLETGMAADG